jgi:ABC-type phosphate transport system ATPase subunit
VHRRGARDQTRCAADGRARVGARSHRRRSAIEELIYQLKSDYTIVIVTHNMQQAARGVRPDGVLLARTPGRGGPTDRIFTNPAQKLTEDYVTEDLAK